jgi:hypothetical protein
MTGCANLQKMAAGTAAGTLKSGMKKLEIARKMARQSGVSRAEAADRLDRIVNELLTNLKRSGQASLPGLGTFIHGADGKLAFQPEQERRDDRA